MVYRILYLLIFVSLSLLVGCSSFLVYPQTKPVSEKFPADLVGDISLPIRSDLAQEQIAYCSYSYIMPEIGTHWAVKIRQVGNKIDIDVNGFSPSPTGNQEGCFGHPKIATASISWSPDGSQILYESDFVTTIRNQIAPNGQQISSTTFLDLPKYTHYHFPRFATWSPDGTQIAFISSRSHPARTFPSLFITSADGRNIRQITNEPTLPGGGRSLAWSHDSTRLAYLLPEPDNGLGIIDATTDTVTKYNPDNVVVFPKQSRELTADLSERNVAWLPGDQLVIFVTKGNSPNHDLLWVMTADGRDLTQLYEGDLRGIALKPDGRWLMMVEVEAQGNYTIKSLSLTATPQLDTLLDSAAWPLAKNEETIIRDLTWSLDGTRLLFAGNPLGNYDLFLWDAVLEEFIQLTDSPIDEAGARWRPRTSQ